MNKIPSGGYILGINLFGVPMLIHWSFPASWVGWGAMLQLAMGQASVSIFLYTSLAVGVIVLVHELGHAIASLATRTKVLALIATSSGGLCAHEPPTTVMRHIIILTGGLLAQALLFLATVAALVYKGAPSGTALTCFTISFTAINTVIFLMNLYPHGSTDGKLLCDIWRQRKFRTPKPTR